MGISDDVIDDSHRASKRVSNAEVSEFIPAVIYYLLVLNVQIKNVLKHA